MKRFFACMMLLALLLSGAQAAVFTDALGREVHVESCERTAALLGSYGRVWAECGGQLIAVAGEAVDAPELAGQADLHSLGSQQTPSMEILFAVEPDFVLLSADLAAHAAIGKTLEQAGIPCAYFSAMDWRSYMDLVELFTSLTGGEAQKQFLIDTVQRPIEAIIAEAQTHEDYGRRSCLLLRASSSGDVRSKRSDDVLSGHILRDMGFANIADSESGLLENLSMEAILMADPDWIFVVIQGSDTEAAMQAIEDRFCSNPAWNTLSAVRNDRVVILPKDLFHLHPNGRWAESYRLIRDLIKTH